MPRVPRQISKWSFVRMSFRSASVLSCLASTLVVAHAQAVDLTVSAVEVNQTINTGTLTLVAKNATVVRVRIGVTGSAAAVPNVDAELRVFSNGVEIPGSPFFSSNGPFSAPLSANTANENDTLNFFCVPPQSGDVDFIVTVDPLNRIAESNETNNEGSLLNRSFVCRKMVELTYVSVNYTPGGGQPAANLIEPGVGDAFLRGIFKTGDWNYHRSQLGALTWTTNINSSNNALLTALNDIRNNTIPAAGFPKPEFIYGWLPGNPYSGNGQAIGVPGAAAFGNTEQSRFQRTFAHEIGHLWGQQHNSLSISTVGFDVVGGLKDPLNLGPIMPTTKKDVMVAGLLTNEAWVAAVTFNDCINDARSACTSADGEDGSSEGGASDAAREERCLRIAGEYLRGAGRIALQPTARLDAAVPSAHDPEGDASVRAYSASGKLLASIRTRTDTLMESCAGEPMDRTPFYVTLPETILGQAIARIEIRDVRTGALLAGQQRSRHAPLAAILGVTEATPVEAQPLGLGDPAPTDIGDTEIIWTANDLDGDQLEATILYSPDGGNAWAPVVVNQPVARGVEQRSRFSSTNLPASTGANGLFRIRVTDGLNQGEFETQGMTFGAGSPPDVHVISPNTNTTVRQHASVVFQASAWDMEDQLLPEPSVVWTSSLDGVVGTGRLFTSRGLRPGVHTMTLTGTDSSGLSTSKVITITVTARDVRSPDLNGDGAVDAADLSLLLGDWGNSDSLADLNLDGEVDAGDLASLLGAF
jgi:hypothetical protein